MFFRFAPWKTSILVNPEIGVTVVAYPTKRLHLKFHLIQDVLQCTREGVAGNRYRGNRCAHGFTIWGVHLSLQLPAGCLFLHLNVQRTSDVNYKGKSELGSLLPL